jgi:hypothetical protein
MKDILMTDPHSDAYYSIQPIDVIERWALCHHLGCVVKYLARTGHKPPVLEQTGLEQGPSIQTSLENLKKAEWYLARELLRPQYCCSTPMGAQPFTTEAVLDGWDLAFHLSEVLFHIKASKSPSMREESLKQAMRHLKAEIASLETHLEQTRLEQARLEQTHLEQAHLNQKAPETHTEQRGDQ